MLSVLLFVAERKAENLLINYTKNMYFTTIILLILVCIKVLEKTSIQFLGNFIQPLLEAEAVLKKYSRGNLGLGITFVILLLFTFFLLYSIH